METISDVELYRRPPKFPASTIEVVITYNEREHRTLAAGQVAASLGTTTFDATDATKIIGRAGQPTADGIERVRLEEITVGPLELTMFAGSVWAEWSNATTAPIGDPILRNCGAVSQQILGQLESMLSGS